MNSIQNFKYVPTLSPDQEFFEGDTLLEFEDENWGSVSILLIDERDGEYVLSLEFFPPETFNEVELINNRHKTLPDEKVLLRTLKSTHLKSLDELLSEIDTSLSIAFRNARSLNQSSKKLISEILRLIVIYCGVEIIKEN